MSASDLAARFRASENEPDLERRKALAEQLYAEAVKAGLMTEYVAAIVGYTRADRMVQVVNPGKGRRGIARLAY